jgi:aspartate racemase
MVLGTRELGRIGLIGGMSWESTAVYYRLINQGIRARLGGLHSADILLHSLDFAPIAAMQASGDWAAAADILAEGARNLEAAGAECIVLCTNTMHKVAAAIEAASNVPFLHIADITAADIKRIGARRPLLLATAFSMEQDFYRERVERAAGCTVVIPQADDRARVHGIIYDELCRGVVSDQSRQTFLGIIDAAAGAGADAIILGCTEIGLLLKPSDHALPMLDTTRLHAEAAIAFACGDERPTPAKAARLASSEIALLRLKLQQKTVAQP